ncbi:hypothetical protein EHW67_02665 [Arenibacter aquaticus]|uniref:Uncharacterized protein n=1 Tax=Arenibacter aquaticus TaxID=2489054 RepID=A0A3S0IQR5_9FLAO|nr:DUF6503 family protein [Arenibacter aquaticus]RTE55485.1 hypothetical protein EHW67_02665 [Arenibacter aquaticus]
MKETFLVIITLLIFGCKQENILDGKRVLNQSIIEHDSLNRWSRNNFFIHIQEPRIANPHRYSILELNNSSNSFKLSRNRDQYISEHIIDSSGNSFVLLDGNIVTDTVLIDKYGLDAFRNIGYKNFYKLLYGLPMSLKDSYKEIINTSVSIFNEEECYKIEMELKDTVISKNWILYISKSNMRIKGVEIIFPEKPDEGERIYFDEIIIINGIKIPRIRHWHLLNDNSYSGTDLIIKELSD